MRFQVFFYLAGAIAAAAPVAALPTPGETAPTTPGIPPKDVTINCKLGHCSESDKETLRQLLELAKSNPEDVQWDITSKITPVKHDPAASPLERRDDATANPEPEPEAGELSPEDQEKAEELAEELAERINHCSSDDCSEEELAALEDDIQVAFWGDIVKGIIGGILKNIDFDMKFDFNYRNKGR